MELRSGNNSAEYVAEVLTQFKVFSCFDFQNYIVYVIFLFYLFSNTYLFTISKFLNYDVLQFCLYVDFTPLFNISFKLYKIILDKTSMFHEPCIQECHITAVKISL